MGPPATPSTGLSVRQEHATRVLTAPSKRGASPPASVGFAPVSSGLRAVKPPEAGAGAAQPLLTCPLPESRRQVWACQWVSPKIALQRERRPSPGRWDIETPEIRVPGQVVAARPPPSRPRGPSEYGMLTTAARVSPADSVSRGGCPRTAALLTSGWKVGRGRVRRTPSGDTLVASADTQSCASSRCDGSPEGGGITDTARRRRGLE